MSPPLPQIDLLRAPELGNTTFLVSDPDAGAAVAIDSLREGSEIPIGRWRLRTRHTPRHRPNHVSYLLVDAEGHELALFSGGALMVGAIARTGLYGPHLATQVIGPYSDRDRLHLAATIPG